MINWFRSIDRLNVRQSHLRRRKRLYCIRNCHYYYIITALYTGEKNTKTTNNQLITAIFNSTFTHTAQHSAVECSTDECSTVEYNTNGDIEKEQKDPSRFLLFFILLLLLFVYEMLLFPIAAVSLVRSALDGRGQTSDEWTTHGVQRVRKLSRPPHSKTYSPYFFYVVISHHLHGSAALVLPCLVLPCLSDGLLVSAGLTVVRTARRLSFSFSSSSSSVSPC